MSGGARKSHLTNDVAKLPWSSCNLVPRLSLLFLPCRRRWEEKEREPGYEVGLLALVAISHFVYVERERLRIEVQGQSARKSHLTNDVA